MSQDSSQSSLPGTPGKSRTRRKVATKKQRRPEPVDPESDRDRDSDSEGSEEEWVRFERDMLAMS